MNKLLCSICKSEKFTQDFNKCESRKTGYQAKCRDCEKEYKKNNKAHIKQRMFLYRKSRIEQEKLQKQEYYKQNKDKIKKQIKTWNKNNKEHIKQTRHAKYLRTKEYSLQKTKEWRNNNREKYREYQRNWTKNKRKTDPHYTIQHRLRNRLLIAFKRGKGQKSASLLELIGCSFDFLINYIKSQFTENMTWEKFLNGEIVIDHIKPCCSFNLENLEEQKACFHYSNLKPLWKKDNEQKIQLDMKQSIRLT